MASNHKRQSKRVVSVSSGVIQPKVRRSDRRAALKKALAGGLLGGAYVIPRRWAEPVLSSATLPAHAEASACAGDASNPQTYNVPGQYAFVVPAGVTAAAAVPAVVVTAPLVAPAVSQAAA